MLLTSLSKYLGIATLLIGSLAGTAFADVYNWTLSGGGDTGSGQLVTGAADGGGHDILSFTGSIDGDPVSLYGGQPGSLGASAPGGIYYDNIIYPSLNSGTLNCAGGATFVDGCGIAINIDGGIGNIWSSYPGDGVSGAGAYIYTSPSYINGNANFTLTAAPEPGVLSTLTFGLIVMSLSVIGIKRRKCIPV